MDIEKPPYVSGHHQSAQPGRQTIRRGMTVSVQFLRKNGQRLSQAERGALPPLTGSLIVTESNDRTKSSLAATIYGQSTSYTVFAPLGKPLIDPQLIHMDERGMVLRGFEIEIIEGRVVEYSQVWLVKPLP